MAIIELSKNELSDISGGSGIPSEENDLVSLAITVKQWFRGLKNALLGRATSSQEGQLACSYRAKEM